MTRRTVQGFAAADLVLAALLLVVESGILFVLALGLDEIWSGSLGLNRLVGRVPRPEMIHETPMFMAGFLGLFVLYLLVLATLAGGGIGLILRKPWGYYSHLAGAALVAVTVFGVIYTIPALLIALRPEFKEYALGSVKSKSAKDLLRDL